MNFEVETEGGEGVEGEQVRQGYGVTTEDSLQKTKDIISIQPTLE